MASQSGFNGTGSSGPGVSNSKQLGSRDLPSKRLLGTGLASVGYETELHGKKAARKDFIGVPSGIFEKEAAVLVGLEDHINVVKTLGWTVNKMSCSLVLEYVDDDLVGLLQKRKQSLQVRAEAGTNSRNDQSDRTRTSDPPFELPEAMGIMEQIARGMEHLHDRGILHGDLKTKNILVARDDQNSVKVKVADFGLVRTKRKSTSFASRQARKLDMARWKAPEILEVLVAKDKDETSSESDSESSDEVGAGSSGRVNDLKLFDGAADVYSFGVTCFQILTGEDPYANLNWRELKASIVAGRLKPNLPATCPPPLRDLLELCWASASHRRGDQAAFSLRPTFSFIRWKLEKLGRAPLTMSLDFYGPFHPQNLIMPVIDIIEFLIEEMRMVELRDPVFYDLRDVVIQIRRDFWKNRGGLCMGSAVHSGYQERAKDWLMKLQRALHLTAIYVHKCKPSNPYKREQASRGFWEQVDECWEQVDEFWEQVDEFGEQVDEFGKQVDELYRLGKEGTRLAGEGMGVLSWDNFMHFERAQNWDDFSFHPRLIEMFIRLGSSRNIDPISRRLLEFHNLGTHIEDSGDGVVIKVSGISPDRFFGPLDIMDIARSEDHDAIYLGPSLKPSTLPQATPHKLPMIVLPLELPVLEQHRRVKAAPTVVSKQPGPKELSN